MIGFLSGSPQRRGMCFAIAIMALALSACGRNGDPLPPPDPNAPPATNSDNPSGLSRPNNPPITPPKRPFILDPLLSEPAKTPQ